MEGNREMALPSGQISWGQWEDTVAAKYGLLIREMQKEPSTTY
jgi:hypothetical protein